jgi:hypothetical protein
MLTAYPPPLLVMIVVIVVVVAVVDDCCPIHCLQKPVVVVTKLQVVEDVCEGVLMFTTWAPLSNKPLLKIIVTKETCCLLCFV